MTTPLPEAFLNRPLAHRGLHDADAGRPENSRAAIEAAVKHGYGIEIDVQLAADDIAMVFHDYALERLTVAMGPVRQRTSAELAAIPLNGNGEMIPTLGEVLELVGGRVPLLIEIKDQDGALGVDVGPLETAVVQALEGYEGDVAVMSFNPHSIAAMKRMAPDIPRGLVTDAFRGEDWPLQEPALERLRDIPDAGHLEAAFISHNVDDLDRPRVFDLKTDGLAILCWTVRTPEVEAKAREIADNITFEGYRPDLPDA